MKLLPHSSSHNFSEETDVNFFKYEGFGRSCYFILILLLIYLLTAVVLTPLKYQLSWGSCCLKRFGEIRCFILQIPILTEESSLIFNVQGSMYRKYIQIYIQQNATLHILFISGKLLYMFRVVLHPSSGAHTTVFTASSTCQTVTATCRYRGRVGTQFQLFHDNDR